MSRRPAAGRCLQKQQKIDRRAGDWLNDAAKADFLTSPPVHEVLELSNLRVWVPRDEYMRAMKCVSARFDCHDLDDTRFLLRHLGIQTPEAAFRIIEECYPRKVILSETQFLLEELLGG